MAHLVAAVPAASREAFAPIIISGDAHPACSNTTDAKTSGHPFATTIQSVLFLHVRRSTSIKGCTDSGLHLINFNIIAKPISGLHAFLSALMHVSSGTGMCAGVLVLEELEHARARGAPILAEFLGGSFTCDAHHMTEPQPQGAGVKLCIERWALNLL